MNYRNNIYEKYNYDYSKTKIKYNNFNKKNFFPYKLHKNIKNFRNNNINNCDNLIDCSKNCPNEKNRNKETKLYYEKIYKGLDFNLKEESLECYKIPKIKNRATLGMQVPNKKFTLDECHENNILNCEKREKTINMKVNPYIPQLYENITEYDKYKKNKCMIDNNLKNENNFRYSNYSNYLKKKKFIKNKY